MRLHLVLFQLMLASSPFVHRAVSRQPAHRFRFLYFVRPWRRPTSYKRNVLRWGNRWEVHLGGRDDSGPDRGTMNCWPTVNQYPCCVPKFHPCWGPPQPYMYTCCMQQSWMVMGFSRPMVKWGVKHQSNSFDWFDWCFYAILKKSSLTRWRPVYKGRGKP